MEDRLRTLRDVRTQIQVLRRQAQLEDVEREQAALDRGDLDTVRLIATARTQLLGMYDEIGGGLNATLADYGEKLRVLKKEREEAQRRVRFPRKMGRVANRSPGRWRWCRQREK